MRLFALLLAWAMASFPVQATEPITICYGSLASLLIPLAQLRNDYAAEGLEVQIRAYPSGLQALQAMLDGDCALATAAVPPIVDQALRRSDFRILAAISSSGDFERIVALRERGIVSPGDLRGRRIGVARATSAHYLLDTFLAAHGLRPGDVEEVYLPAQQLASALRAGDVDAVAWWEPFVRRLARELGERAQVFSLPGLVVSPFLLVVREDVDRQQPAVVTGVLRALVRAQRALAQAPDEARRMLLPTFGFSPDEYDFVRSLHEYGVTLDQPLPFILENAARWQIGLLPPDDRPAMPNFLGLIDLSRLRSVDPEAVSIVD